MAVGTGRKEACLGWKPRLTRVHPVEEGLPFLILPLLGGEASGSMSVEWPSSAVQLAT